MLGEFSEEMDQTSSRMDSVLKKMEKVSHMTSSKCLFLYCVFLSTLRQQPYVLNIYIFPILDKSLQVN